MGEAAGPADQRRGAVAGRHPLEAPIDPETGDAVPARAPPGKGRGKRELLPGKDRWGLDPVGKGWYRGNVSNIVRMSEVTQFGELITYHFDLIGNEGQPPLLIEFVGYTFSKDIRPSLVVDLRIGDSFPTERLRCDRLRLAYDKQNDLRAYMPVQNRHRMLRKNMKFGIMTIILPIFVVSGLIWLAKNYLHLF